MVIVSNCDFLSQQTLDLNKMGYCILELVLAASVHQLHLIHIDRVRMYCVHG